MPDLGQTWPQGGNGLCEGLLEEQHLAVEGIEDEAVVIGGIARVDRDPGHVCAPQSQCASPAGHVVGRPDRALGLRGKAQGEELVGNATRQRPDFVETEAAIILDVGNSTAVHRPAAVEKVDDRHVARSRQQGRNRAANQTD